MSQWLSLLIVNFSFTFFSLSKDFHWVENNRALDWEGLWAPGEPNDDGLLDASACGLLSAVDG